MKGSAVRVRASALSISRDILFRPRRSEGLRGLPAAYRMKWSLGGPAARLPQALGLVLTPGRLNGVAVEYVGVQVGPIRPHDRSEFIVHADPPKELRIVAKRFEDGSP